MLANLFFDSPSIKFIFSFSTGTKDPCGSFTCPVNRKCVIDSYGEPSCICSEICKPGDDLTGLVCARNGIEYPNLCALKQASCKGPPIKVKQFGPCKPCKYTCSRESFLEVDCPFKEPQILLFSCEKLVIEFLNFQFRSVLIIIPLGLPFRFFYT